MRLPFFIALLTASLATNFSLARGIDSIANALVSLPDYAAKVSYAVTLPQADDDVVYTVSLRQPDASDSYLIDWSVMSPSGPVEGFTAWFNGHFYNFRNRRLQEYHADWDTTATPQAKPIQDSAQFASLLPRRIAQTLREVESSPGYTCSVTTRGDEVKVEAVRQLAGEPDAEMTWIFNSETLAPKEFYGDYNPGAITGQQVKATYNYDVDGLGGAVMSEEFLRSRYPEAFSRYRESQFSIENMRGDQLPAFSLPNISGGRLARQAADGFDFPTVVALLDSESPLAADFVSAIRGAINRLPFTANVIWAASSKNPREVSELLGNLAPEETALTAAATLALSCGASVLPVVMVCDTSGKITDLAVGMNNTLTTDVIQMLTH
ncbi:MAG: hypothetical protein NC301_02525 [Bacteroides sp.]|nr:hypothetical protein [Bacteroides sp.]MCM1379607.1 hypothetical protein [Bacteroides sp.]MCM1446011.1 hypothetical protein [Prevotella sp.]